MRPNTFSINSIFFAITIAVISIMAWTLVGNYSDYFDRVYTEYKEKEIIDLSKPISVEVLSEYFIKKGYLDKEEDASFIANAIKKRFFQGEKLNDLKDFRKKEWCLTIDEIKSSNCVLYKEKLNELQSNNTVPDSLINHIIPNPLLQTGTISANVVEKKVTTNVFLGYIEKILGKDEIPCKDVVVRLCEHSRNFLVDSETTDSIIGYSKTDKNGKVTFKWLDPNKSYSVLPISSQYKYGNEKGTFGGNLLSVAKDGNLKINQPFIQRPITIQMFSNSTLNKMKTEHSIIVRSPKSFKKAFVKDIVTVLFCWIALFVTLSILAMRKGVTFEKSIITCLTFLTCISLIMMYSMTDPLTDELRGHDTAVGIEVGIVAIALLFFTNIISFYQDKSKISFDSLSEKYSFIPKGFSYVLVALLLTFLLFTPLGKDVGGMKVNLDLGFKFQPSEIAKYLVVVYMAAFFCTHENAIIKYSQTGNAGLFWSKVRYMGAIIIGLSFLILLYMFLGDMGPGLVIAITFIILYSSIKSKIIIQNGKSWNYSQIFSSDIMLLFWGVVSFCVMLYIGSTLEVTWIFALIWFILWLAGGFLLKKQIYESPVMFNLIITLFVFGGRLFNFLSNIPLLEKLQSIGERLDSRAQMCINTWGELGIGDSVLASENSQVADGLWGLASGGFCGQGIGEGYPDRIPAFHTDMILSSIGENLGFVFLLAIVIVLSILLKKSVIAGYRTGNKFGLFLAMGIAIVTAVQFFVIAFGSTGIIPLTGVTVPFLSYGKVSLILNLFAFGVILSMSKRVKKQKPSTTLNYKYTISLISLVYIVLAFGICGTYLNYQLFNRNSTLVRPLFVTNNSGVPLIEYNPRIQILTSLLHAGNIYDRNGVLLATSNVDTLRSHADDYVTCNIDVKDILFHKDKRMYPFGNHTLFMLGNIDEQFLSEGYGYMAEGRHLSYLRGFDNQKYDEQGNPVKVSLTSRKYSYSPFLPDSVYTSPENYSLRDYSILLPLLKEGIRHNDRIDEINNKISSFWHTNEIKPKDLHLTIDAKLQYSIQDEMQRYVEKNYSGKGWNCLRMSAVILDADNGDLLTSAIYPLPDLATIKDNNTVYSDKYKGKEWKAYSDMDLGLKYPTAPGSTAKVMTALAGIKKKGIDATKQTYYVHPLERIEVFKNGSGEPSGKNVSMEEAIVISSNCYFINLLNDYNLYKELSTLYKMVGVQCNFRNDEKKVTSLIPYSLSYEENEKINRKWNPLFDAIAASALNRFEKYDSRRKNPQLKRAEDKYRKMNDNEWALAWGQGNIEATPLVMSRVASMVAQNGHMPITNYIIANDDEKKKLDSFYPYSSIPYIDKQNISAVSILSSYMEKQADKFDIGKPYKNTIGGKTGTPERVFVQNGKTAKKNDAWYICYIKDCNVNGERHNLAVAVRMERINSGLSGRAMNLVSDVILPQLAKLNYIQYRN